METFYPCFVTLSTGSKHKITQETYNQILEAGKDDFISLPNGTIFKSSAIMEIQDIKDWVDENYNYGQTYTDVKELPGVGFKGIIDLATDVSHIEAIARGLNKAKAKFDRPTPHIEEFLKLARKKYQLIKSGYYANK